MRPITRFFHLMSSAVSVEEPTGTRDDYGAPAYGAAVSYRAHLSRRRRLVRNALGEQVVSMQALYLGTADPVGLEARLTLSTGDVGSTEDRQIHPRLIAVERRFDQKGPHHTVLYCE